MLDLKDITYQPQTGNKKILDDISFNLHENEIILICGKKWFRENYSIGNNKWTNYSSERKDYLENKNNHC